MSCMYIACLGRLGTIVIHFRYCLLLRAPSASPTVPPPKELSLSRDAMTKACAAPAEPNQAWRIGSFGFPVERLCEPAGQQQHHQINNPSFRAPALRSNRPLRSSPQPPIANTMFLQRTAVAAARRAAVTPVMRRSFTASMLRRRLFPIPPPTALPPRKT